MQAQQPEDYFSDYFPVLISSLFSALENTQTKSLWKCNVNSDVPTVKRKCHFGNNQNMLVGFDTGYDKTDLEMYIPNGEKIPIFKLHWMHTIYKIQRKIRQNDSNTLQKATASSYLIICSCFSPPSLPRLLMLCEKVYLV